MQVCTETRRNYGETAVASKTKINMKINVNGLSSPLFMRYPVFFKIDVLFVIDCEPVLYSVLPVHLQSQLYLLG
jgi:hypothetical protein